MAYLDYATRNPKLWSSFSCCVVSSRSICIHKSRLDFNRRVTLECLSLGKKKVKDISRIASRRYRRVCKINVNVKRSKKQKVIDEIDRDYKSVGGAVSDDLVGVW